jgi:hypothetical protein
MRWLAIVLLLTTIAHADPAPSFAVGLRSKDRGADDITLALETALRTAGTRKTATYRSTTTRKQLVAALVKADCMITEEGCAVAAGNLLGVDYMLVGITDLRGRRFELTLDVIKVANGKRVRSLRDLSPPSNNATTWARTIFSRVIDDATGELILTANVSRGVVLLDGKPVTELFERRASVPDIAVGTHALEIRATGHKTYSGDVTIEGPTKLSIMLEPDPPSR